VTASSRYLRGGEVVHVQWDLGLGGFALLVGMSAAFGLLAEVVMWRSTTHWVGAIAGTVFLVAGLLTSEVWFGWATAEDLQPNIDGLSFDEVLLIGVLAGAAAIVLTRLVGRRRHPSPHP
jgi:hypothetical protein